MHGSIPKHPATAGDNVVATKKTRRRRKRQMSRSQRFKLKAKDVSYSPDRVRTVLEWCVINGFSEDTGRRIIARGEIPVLQLSSKRLGIRDSDNRKWQDSRVRGGK
jgi:hypothetical protein